jgi:hypothetical protein
MTKIRVLIKMSYLGFLVPLCTTLFYVYYILSGDWKESYLTSDALSWENK